MGGAGRGDTVHKSADCDSLLYWQNQINVAFACGKPKIQQQQPPPQNPITQWDPVSRRCNGNASVCNRKSHRVEEKKRMKAQSIKTYICLYKKCYPTTKWSIYLIFHNPIIEI